jgi:hypothetical protein
MNPIEWIAAVFAIGIIIKFASLSIKPKEYINWAENFMKPNNVRILSYIELVFFFLFAYIILQEISIIQFFIAMLAGMALMAHTMMHYPKVIRLYIKQFKSKKNSNIKIMFDWLIWLLLSAWVLKELFF